MTATRNIAVVARRLRDLGIEDIVFVGGAVVELLTVDPGAPQPRYTVDVDAIVAIASIGEYYRLEARLRDAGHTQPMEGPICRWWIEGIQVDLMPTEETILGFGNRWYAAALDHALQVSLADEGQVVRVLSAPYMIATKLDAFGDRGDGDFLMSKDIEDILILLDGRKGTVAEVAAADQDVRSFIADAFRALLANPRFTESIPGHLFPDQASQQRVPIILERMQRIAQG